MLLGGGVASAGPPSAPRDERPAAAPPPDGVRNRPLPTDNRRMVGVLEVRVEGLSEDVRNGFQKQLEDQIDNKRFRLADRGYMKKAMARSTRWTDGCVVGRCLTEVHAQAGAELVLLAALTGSGTSFGYIVTLIRTDSGRVVDQESERCDVCTVNEVIGQATLAALRLINNVPDSLPDEGDDRRAAIDLAVGKVDRELAEHQRHTTRLGVTLVAIGVVGAIAGGALYMIDSTKPTYAVATAAGGAAMATGGLIVLAF